MGANYPENVVRVCTLFFFFQAEDGIRDVAVTGVQTCALPISAGLLVSISLSASGRCQTEACTCWRQSNQFCHKGIGVAAVCGLQRIGGGEIGRRSEERRVGEEGRFRGSPDHLKKKKNTWRTWK